MTTPRPKGWLARLQSSMAPLADPDDKSPIVRPVVVIVSMALCILSGVIFLYAGVGSLLTADQQLQSQQDLWTKVVAQCESDPAIGAIGDKVPATLSGTPTLTTPIAATSLQQVCKQVTTPQIPADQVSSMKTQLSIISVVVAVFGAAILGAGFYLRTGARWTRRVLIAVAVLSLLMAMLLQVSSTFTLVATLLLVIGILLVYVGKGGLYFARLNLQRRQH